MSRARVVTALCGGLGNQLFIYAAARRLAIVQDRELILDRVSRFRRDRRYRRQCVLDHFNVQTDGVSPHRYFSPGLWDLYWWGQRKRDRLLRWTGRDNPDFLREARRDPAFDPRLLAAPSPRQTPTLALEGFWQSERYFADMASTIRAELTVVTPHAPHNQATAQAMAAVTAVAIHVRRLDYAQALDGDYYRRAVAWLRQRVANPVFFCFGDDLPWLAAALGDAAAPVLVDQNPGDHAAHEDLWLMSRCRHFIIANSTFSWWGAWLGEHPDKQVVAPRDPGRGFNRDFFPESWVRV
ncbi:MAG: alpha-1,2-fucosyltransferase [Magnetococcales bacterium]|nr:alpha-1,2-fucosyltransferase [Magnetococcales bacterium]